MSSKTRVDAAGTAAVCAASEKLAALGIEDISIDDFLGGVVRLIQPRTGYRVSMDTILLAAAIPAKSGERILEAGAGTGAAALCLAHRCPGVSVDGLEIQAQMVEIARCNAALNRGADRVSFTRSCITEPPVSLEAGTFDHVFANPPYLECDAAIAPPAPSKSLAHVNSTARLKDWVDFCLAMVRVKGTVSFIYRADHMDELISLLYGRAGELVLCPLWPRAGRPAKRVLIQARKGLGGVATMLPGIVLHGDVERYSPEAEAILRDGGAIDLRAGRDQSSGKS